MENKKKYNFITFNDKIKEFVKGVIQKEGKPIQYFVILEEMAELQKEICKYQRLFDNRYEIVEELADLFIVLIQLIDMFDFYDEINKFIYEKIKKYQLFRHKIIEL